MFLYVKIYYGPCEDFYTLSHKPQKLLGLRDQLLKLGYRVDLVPVEFRNYCVLEMCGYEIFRCNISNLSFNTSCAPDPVCARAVAAVESASLRLQRANTYLWLRDYLAEEIFLRNQLGPKAHWLPKVEPSTKPASVQDCIKCCRILTSKNKCN
ncbi:UPF0728 protein v1g117062 [Plutella xylostella]|uniref:UPF0728 protein v1g117062 n=1 Tax=Plutella xylostella TaxID=51655 RepID=UPI002032AC61|nr:UPF0728 protein v1g117062 [Plutella xylostella]